MVFLFHIASSDIQSELGKLGVSIYNQEDLEEGVLRQIDEEVQRRNAEQTKAFLVKDYQLIKSDIKLVERALSIYICMYHFYLQCLPACIVCVCE